MTAARLPPALSPITPSRVGVATEVLGMAGGPEQRVVAVLDAGGEPVRRRQPVVDRHHDRVEPLGDDAAAPVTLPGAAEHEAAAVEVHDHRARGARPGLRGVDPQRQVAVPGRERVLPDCDTGLEPAEEQAGGTPVRDDRLLHLRELLGRHPSHREPRVRLHHSVDRPDPGRQPCRHPHRIPEARPTRLRGHYDREEGGPDARTQLVEGSGRGLGAVGRRHRGAPVRAPGAGRGLHLPPRRLHRAGDRPDRHHAHAEGLPPRAGAAHGGAGGFRRRRPDLDGVLLVERGAGRLRRRHRVRRQLRRHRRCPARDDARASGRSGPVGPRRSHRRAHGRGRQRADPLELLGPRDPVRHLGAGLHPRGLGHVSRGRRRGPRTGGPRAVPSSDPRGVGRPVRDRCRLLAGCGPRLLRPRGHRHGLGAPRRRLDGRRRADGQRDPAAPVRARSRARGRARAPTAVPDPRHRDRARC